MKKVAIALFAVILFLGCGSNKSDQLQTELDLGILYMQGDSLMAPDTTLAMTHFLSGQKAVTRKPSTI